VCAEPIAAMRNNLRIHMGVFEICAGDRRYQEYEAAAYSVPCPRRHLRYWPTWDQLWPTATLSWLSWSAER